MNKLYKVHSIAATGATFTKASLQTNSVLLGAYLDVIKPYTDKLGEGFKLDKNEAIRYAATQAYYPNHRAIELIEKKYSEELSRKEEAELAGIEEFYPYPVPMELVMKERLNTLSPMEEETLKDFRREKIEYSLHAAPHLNNESLDLVLFRLGFNKPLSSPETSER